MRTSVLNRQGFFCFFFLPFHYFIFPCSVTRRCFPALGIKENEITVGNSTSFPDGRGKTVKASDLLPAVK